MIKIAITGPESTGKTFLSEMLAAHFHCLQRPEFARTYLESINRPYRFDDLLAIAIGQQEAEEDLIQKNIPSKFLLCDTELTVIKIWSEDKFGTCDPRIISAWEEQDYDLYLLMKPDLAWEPDPQREDPHRRDYLFSLYQSELKILNANVIEIGGGLEQRFEKAVKVIDRLQK
jgi:nicotinamide riboside kinase